jgi:hypothetical protein
VTERILTLRELNRATLARQCLLERASLAAPDAIEQLAGLQAQVNNPPYIGLWTRLRDFRRADLTAAIERRAVVRGALLRSTLHLATAADYPLLWPAIQPALERALRSFFGKEVRDLDLAPLVAAARSALAERPRSSGEQRAILAALAPDRDPAALAYAVRSYLPLVQVPPGGIWGKGGSPAYALAESWLDRPLAGADESLRALVQRYLAAFGPASARDFQTWSGLIGQQGTFDALRAELHTYRDEQGRELFDLPDHPLPPADTAAPARFLPEYDNLLLAHADRTRVIADAYRPLVFLSSARVRSTFLLDGFVQGAWKIERDKRTATLIIEPFAPLSASNRQALTEEAERLIRFIADEGTAVTVRFADPE